MKSAPLGITNPQFQATENQDNMESDRISIATEYELQVVTVNLGFRDEKEIVTHERYY